ncbi:DedA family protein [Streptomyces sp. NPDC053542]|uniref:DedA family protein n=1 Tax=Streptomyces sp. NPDC053542 TaxID=3365710 RepID=UPI0037D05E51
MPPGWGQPGRAQGTPGRGIGAAVNALAMYGLLALTTAPPLVPNSALLAWAGVLAARGTLPLPLVLLTVTGSAVAGDLILHATARRFGGPARRWLQRNEKRRAILERASAQLERHGVPFVAGLRFLPAGRVAGALATGVVRYPVRRYFFGSLIAESVWATYSVGIGYLGRTAAGGMLPSLILAIGVSLTVAAAGALVPVLSGRYRARRKKGRGQGAAQRDTPRPDGCRPGASLLTRGESRRCRRTRDSAPS